MSVKNGFMRDVRYLLLAPLLFALFWLLPLAGYAQEDTDATPAATATPQPEESSIPEVHTVQEGENLTTIAAQYGVTVADLLLVNGLDEDALIYPGQELAIPGAAGDAVPTTYTVQVGDTLPGLATRFNSSVEEIAEPNHLISPSSLYAGQRLSIISKTGSAEPQPVSGTVHYVQPGETLLMLATRYGISSSAIITANNLPMPGRLFPNMRLLIPADDNYQVLPASWEAVVARPAPLEQGQTMSIYVENALPGEPQGEFAGRQLHFTPYEDGYMALVGVDAFTEPGRYELTLEGTGETAWWPFSQEVQVVSAGYLTQTINVPAELETLLAPEVRAEEDEFLSSIYRQFTPEQQWDGLFQFPVSTTVVTAGYGGVRSYNGGPFEIFHTGVDLAGTTGTPILAPAAGTVVFTGTVQLRGNIAIIDHGLGVMSGYYHLSEVQVQVGEKVEPGQVIGLGGSTGLSTGPHLHWELRVMDVPVNGLQWTEAPFP